MGRLILPAAGPVYIDANVTIYRFEGIEPYSTASAPLWSALQDRSMLVVTSELTLPEVLVKPIKEQKGSLVSIYRRVLLQTQGLDCLPINRDVLELAAQIRAVYRLKTPDAIHAASSLLAEASMFLTNDPAFRRIPGLNVVILDEVVASESD